MTVAVTPCETQEFPAEIENYRFHSVLMPDDFTRLWGLLLGHVKGLRDIFIIYKDDGVGKQIFFLWKPAFVLFS